MSAASTEGTGGLAKLSAEVWAPVSTIISTARFPISHLKIDMSYESYVIVVKHAIIKMTSNT